MRRPRANEIALEANGYRALLTFNVRYCPRWREIEVHFLFGTLEHVRERRRITTNTLEEAENLLGELSWCHDAVAAKADPNELMSEAEADDADHAIDAWKEDKYA